MHLLKYFDELEDPRNIRHRNYHHKLTDILALTLLGTLSGADDWEEMQTFGEANKSWLQTHFDFHQGIPSHDTLSRLFQLMESACLQSAFQCWIHSICQNQPDLIAMY